MCFEDPAVDWVVEDQIKSNGHRDVRAGPTVAFDVEGGPQVELTD